MTYKEIERAASQESITDAQNGTELLHVLALVGLVKLFSEHAVTPARATEIKGQFREAYETAEKPIPERFTAEELREVADIQDKIHHATLCNGNPWAIMLQACKAVSVLLRDDGMFWRNMKEDTYLIYGGVLEDSRAYEAEREEIVRSMEKLLEAVQREPDVRHKHILSRAIEEHKAQLAALDEKHGSGEQQNLFGG